MHRVELKVTYPQRAPRRGIFVPNAPCGVESSLYNILRNLLVQYVPNAPCGVERD